MELAGFFKTVVRESKGVLFVLEISLYVRLIKLWTGTIYLFSD